MAAGVKRIDRLVGNVLWAIDHGLPRSELLPMLEQLLTLAPPGSLGARLAKQHLSRLVVAEQPWRAARLASELLAESEESDAAWAVLGMAHMVMGNYRSARRAYLNALALAPGAPAYSHNLGHLLDVAFDRPRDALPHLRSAYEAIPEEPELASSYAHALVRLGLVERGRSVLESALGGLGAADRVISRWLARYHMTNDVERRRHAVGHAP